jgi:tetratricopeptide (TPR) repeat protein
MSNLYEQIESYLSGEMAPSEKQAFETQMAADPEIAEQVQALKEARSSIVRQLQSEEGTAAFRKIVSEVVQEKPGSGREAVIRPLWRRKPWVSIAAAAAFIALALLVWQPWQTALYPQFAHHPELSLTVRSDDNAEIAKQLETAFNAGDYRWALSLFREYRQERPEDVEAVLYEGICLLELGEYEPALSNFQILHTGTSANRYDGTWYLALTYLRRWESEKNPGDLQQCRSYLEQIPEGSNHYEEAGKLLKKVEG